MDRIIDLSEDYDEAVACYAGAMGQVNQALPINRTAQKPWWKFW
jgi:hypothetical protein